MGTKCSIGAVRCDNTMLTGVRSNTPNGDGSIESTVAVRATNTLGAKSRALNRALLHNGYTKALKNVRGFSYTINDVKIEDNGLGQSVYVVDLTLKGLN